MSNEQNLQLVVFTDEDVALFAKWLDKDYIYKWFCCEGKDDEQSRIDGQTEKQEWLDEVKHHNEYSHRHLFIVTCDGQKVGFGICLDLAGEPDYTKEQYPDLFENPEPGMALEIGYCIGEEEYLGKGLGKIMIRMLEEECHKLGASIVLADPNEKNIPSINVLIANGFEKHKDCDYRKKLN